MQVKSSSDSFGHGSLHSNNYSSDYSQEKEIGGKK